MVDFVPLPMSAFSPDAVGDSRASNNPAAPTGPTKLYYSARTPISRTVDLNTMAGGTLLTGTTYRRDFFLCGPLTGAVQGVWLGASANAGQPDMKVGLVDESGNVVAAMEQLVEVTTRAKLLLELAATTADRSLYLRVETQAQAVLLYVTLDATLDEVM